MSLPVMKAPKVVLLAALGGFFALTSTFAQTWTQTSAPTKAWTCVASSADGNKLTAAVGYTHKGPIYISTNSGITWMTTSAPSNNDWNSIASSADGSKIVAEATSQLIYVSTNSGATWTQASGGPSGSWTAVACSANGVKLVAASQIDYQTYAIYVSTNSGITWSETTSIIDSSLYIYVPFVVSSADGCELATSLGDGRIYTSTNSGLTWNLSASNFGARPLASSADGAKCVAANLPGGGIYLSQSTPTPPLNLTLNKQEPLAFLARAFDKFCFAAKRRFVRLDGFDKSAGFESHQSAKRSFFAALRQQQLFPAQNALNFGHFK